MNATASPPAGSVIHGAPVDNVVTCCVPISSGQTVIVEGITTTAAADIPIYHKMAIRTIGKGETVYKYGQPIGIASQDIFPGQHVHVQNLESARGRGDKKKGETV